MLHSPHTEHKASLALSPPVQASLARPQPPQSSLAPSVLSPPAPTALIVPAAQASTPAEAPQAIQEDPSASFPSPQDTSNNEDEQTSEPVKPVIEALQHDLALPDDHVVSISSEDPQHPPATFVPQQTRTPPEEDRIAMAADTPASLDVAGNAEQDLDRMRQDSLKLRQPSMVESISAAETAGDTDSPRPRPRRGWPKGKPRGPRNKNTGTKPRSTVRRSRASARINAENGSTVSSDDTSPPAPFRRKSHSDLAALAVTTLGLAPSRHSSVPPNVRYEILTPRLKSSAGRRASKKVALAEDIICSGCSKARESTHGELDQWIGCNGCKGWFHYDCAGFKNERDVRDVDKFFCRPCEPQHGATTFVRKSTRTHTNVDYAGLNQGILKTSDEDPEHHYVQPIKDGTFTFDPETFPRMRPELVTAEYFETCSSFTEPVLIPAEWNPKRQPDLRPHVEADAEMPDIDGSVDGNFDNAEHEDTMTKQMEYETVFDDGQDKLGMIVPQGLTVRHVSNIVGPDEPLEVIDVKTQGTEGKWNLAKFADYYEADGEKAVRNVISLEVSHTKLGKLLQRPKVVRQIDLQDSVWPAEESAKGNYPKVQYYCLMSVADSFTDFHIDFGGSSVYYHILRGRKTFFFIPPKPSHLKAYEDWNNSPEQNFTWLPSKTKECYRVDLYEGDTMLIPSGWIHAVWTPTNSLVIGGNFLTRLHYSTQFRIVDIEKANKTPLKFRYPQFQKVMWYAVIKYLEADPLPADVAQRFFQGDQFHRERPTWQDFFGDVSETARLPGTADYNARYYSQAELDGLPELISFIFRTVMISLGRIEGVSEDTRKKVVRSIPKSHGDPLDVAKAFALWVAWKRGNEDPPAWAHPEAGLPDKEAAEPKKLSARALKQLQRQEAINAYRLAPDRHSARQQASRDVPSVAEKSPAPSYQQPPGEVSMTSSTFTSTPKTSVLGPKRVACDACRKRRIRCKHKEHVTQTTPGSASTAPAADFSFSGESQQFQVPDAPQFGNFVEEVPSPAKLEFPQTMGVAPIAPMMAADVNGPALIPGNALLADQNSKRGRSKACLDCRKSKVSTPAIHSNEPVSDALLTFQQRRCVHDEAGRVDPIKAEQTPVPRGFAGKKRKYSEGSESPLIKKSKQSAGQGDFDASQSAPTMPHPMGPSYNQSAALQQFPQQQSYSEQPAQSWPQSTYMYPDPMDAENVAINDGPYHQPHDMQASYSQQTLEQLANDVLDSRYVNNDEDGGYTVPQHAVQAAMPGAAQPSSYAPQLQYQNGRNLLVSQSHHSSDSGVAFPDGQHIMGGAVQDYRPGAVNGTHDERGAGSNLDLNKVTSVNGQSASRVPPTHTPMSNGERQSQVTPHAQGSNDIDSAAIMPSKGLSDATIMNGGPPTAQATLTGSVASVPVPSLGPAFSPQMSKPNLSGIPLYEPPPSASKRRSSGASLHFDGRATETPQQNGRHRHSASKTPVPMGPPGLRESPGSTRKRKRDSGSMAPGHKPKMDVERASMETEDDESLRLAKELQGQDWGLRRRSREA